MSKNKIPKNFTADYYNEDYFVANMHIEIYEKYTGI